MHVYVANSAVNILQEGCARTPRIGGKGLPPQNPSKCYANMIPKKPPTPASQANYAQPLKRRLSGDYYSNDQIQPQRLAGLRHVSPQLQRIPSAGNNIRQPLANIRPKYF